jgi:hypothetical protein
MRMARLLSGREEDLRRDFLGGPQPVADVYARCYEALPKGGVLANGDFVKPDGTTFDYEAGRFEVGRHLEISPRGKFL